MSEIINLRRARKQKERAANAAEAEAKRLAHGRTKQEKTLSKTLRETERAKLEAHKRDKGRSDDE